MRAFRYEAVQGLQPTPADALHERWTGRHASGRDVVLLRLRLEHARRESVAKAWLAQAARGALCQAPGLLGVLDHGMHAGVPHLAREHFSDALPLAGLLTLLQKRGEVISPMLAMHVVRALCTLLSTEEKHADAGPATPLLHGDLCAERIFVRSDGQLLLAELGLWTALPSIEAVQLRAGSDAFEHLAPELSQGVTIDGRADVYALGILLRRMLVPGSGKPGPAATRNSVPAMPPPEMVMLMSRLIAPSAAERPADAASLLRELSGFEAHAAGAPVLSQLHEDARRSFAHVAPSRPTTSQKTAVFFTPAAAPQPPAASAAGLGGGFRGRTQLFVPAATTQPTAHAHPQPEPPGAVTAPVVSAGVAARSRGTLRLTHDDPPVRSVPPDALAAERDALPPLLRAPCAPPVSQTNLVAMPPLLRATAAASEVVVSHAAPPSPHEVSAVRVVPPESRREARVRAEPAATRQHVIAADDAAAHAGVAEALAAIVAEPRSGGGAPLPVEDLSVPELADAQRARPAYDAPLAHSSRAQRAPWREASDTVFKLKAPVVAAKLVPIERLSPRAMFVIAMLVASVVVVCTVMLVRLIV